MWRSVKNFFALLHDGQVDNVYIETLFAPSTASSRFRHLNHLIGHLSSRQDSVQNRFPGRAQDSRETLERRISGMTPHETAACGCALMAGVPLRVACRRTSMTPGRISASSTAKSVNP